MNESFPKAHLESLWAPWRVEYLQMEKPTGDFLTAAAQATNDADHYVISRRKTAFLLMNGFPYSSGHLMAVPYRKVAGMDDLTDDEILDLWKLCVHAQNLLKQCVKAQGFNVGCNIGSVAGAGVADHLHLHIVPRWSGDANFMTTIGGARVLPEGLRPLYDRLIAAQQSLQS